METAIWIIVCIILCFVAGAKTNKARILKKQNEANEEIMALRADIIANQQATINNYKTILANGIDLPTAKSYRKEGFEAGRLYEAGELELNTEGRNTAFEVWHESINKKQ